MAAELPVAIGRLHADDVDMMAIEAIDRASFSPPTGVPLDEELRRPFTRAWTARCALMHPAATPVGFLVTWVVADELHVLNIATDPAVRRRGVGRALMDHALRFAREKRLRLVVLEVRRSNRAAIRLYRQLGFRAMGLRASYYADNGEDALEMVVVLDPETGHIVPGRDEVRCEEV